MPAFIERIRAFLGGTGQLDRPSSALEAPEPTTEPSPIPHADLGFALAMYWQLHQGRRNLFFSPLNIRSALGMALLGARGETAAQLRQGPGHRVFGRVL